MPPSTRSGYKGLAPLNPTGSVTPTRPPATDTRHSRNPAPQALMTRAPPLAHREASTPYSIQATDFPCGCPGCNAGTVGC
ncbi:MAG: hypothetical protein AAGF95_31800 [Chloroflexota bacterium]